MQFKMQPNITDIVEDLAKEGFVVDLESARAVWDKATLFALGDSKPRGSTEALAKHLSPEMWGDVRSKVDAETGMPVFGSLSDLLETEDPTEPGSRDEMLGIDAFQRLVSMLDVRGVPIRLTSDPIAGTGAHTVLDFINAGPLVAGQTRMHVGQVLLQELFVRAYNEGTHLGTQRFRNNSLFYSSASPLWPGLNPTYLTQPIAGQPRLRTPLLPQMLAIRSVVKSDTFKWPLITNQASQSRLRRVAEGAALPVVKLSVSSATGKVYKFGVAIEVTDETARRVPIDWLRFTAARIGVQNALDKEQVCFEAAVAAGTEYNMIGDSMDAGATANFPTSTALDNFLGIMEENGFPPTIAIGPRAATTALKNATTGTAEQSVFRGNNPVMRGGSHPEELDHPPIYSRTYGSTGKITYIDGTSAMGEATEAGADKQETDRDIIRGVNILTISEVVGYFAIESAYGAVQVLDIGN